MKKKTVITVEPISAKGPAAQMPLSPSKGGKTKMQTSSNTIALTIEIIAETSPLLRAVKKLEPKIENPAVKKTKE